MNREGRLAERQTEADLVELETGADGEEEARSEEAGHREPPRRIRAVDRIEAIARSELEAEDELVRAELAHAELQKSDDAMLEEKIELARAKKSALEKYLYGRPRPDPPKKVRTHAASAYRIADTRGPQGELEEVQDQVVKLEIKRAIRESREASRNQKRFTWLTAVVATSIALPVAGAVYHAIAKGDLPGWGYILFVLLIGPLFYFVVTRSGAAGTKRQKQGKKPKQ